MLRPPEVSGRGRDRARRALPKPSANACWSTAVRCHSRAHRRQEVPIDVAFSEICRTSRSGTSLWPTPESTRASRRSAASPCRRAGRCFRPASRNGSAPIEQLLRIDPQPERPQHERPMQIDLDAIVRMLVDARLAEPHLEPRSGLRPLSYVSERVRAARTPARSRPCDTSRSRSANDRRHGSAYIVCATDAPFSTANAMSSASNASASSSELALDGEAPRHRVAVRGEQLPQSARRSASSQPDRARSRPRVR